ncbi:MAG: hypothetical protein RSC91_08305 [Clostridia bacterium]
MKKRKVLRSGLLYTMLTLLALITLFPLLWAISASLRTDKEMFQYIIPFSYHTLIPLEVTFDSYVQLFRDFNFLTPMINTMVLIVIIIPLGCIINSIAAYAFASFEFKGKRVLYAIILTSFMIPFESIAMPLYSEVLCAGHYKQRREGIRGSL